MPRKKQDPIVEEVKEEAVKPEPKKRARKAKPVEETPEKAAAPVKAEAPKPSRRKSVKTAPAETAEAPAPAPAPEPEPRKASARKSSAKKAEARKEPVYKTIIQVGEMEFDISDVAKAAYKQYKSVHKRKAVNDFVVYIKPEENAAYYTVNGEGSEEFKIDL